SSCRRSVGSVRITRQRRQSGRIGWDRARRGAAVIGELDVSRLVSVNMRMGRISSMVGLRGDMNQVIGGGLGPLVLWDRSEGDSRIKGRVMVRAWLERRWGVVAVTAQRLSERAAHDDVVIRRGRLRRGLFAGCRHGRLMGGLTTTAIVRSMPGRLCSVVPRHVDRISIRPVRYDGRIDRIRTIELRYGSRIDLERPRF